MGLSTIKLDLLDKVAVLTFNRPGQLNAMSRKMMQEITETLARLEADSEVRAIVLTGSGKAFMAGADIKEYALFDNEDFRAFQLAGRHMYERIERNVKPVIAAVNGYALGGGFEMVLACDLVVAQSGVRLGLPEVYLGLVPGGGGTQRLVERLGSNLAFELMATGDHRPAEDFQAWGLVNKVVDEDPVLSAVALAEKISVHSSESITAVKRLVRLAKETSLSAGLDAEAVALQSLYENSGGRDRINEFAARSVAKKSKE